MSADALFGPLFAPARLREQLSARAWVEAMLETEAALAAAEAEAGVIPAAAADAIAAAVRPGAVDVSGLGEASLGAGNPVVPLVAALRAAVGGDAASYVHWGATSQDVLDTAAMLCRAARSRSWRGARRRGARLRRAGAHARGHADGGADAAAAGAARDVRAQGSRLAGRDARRRRRPAPRAVRRAARRRGGHAGGARR